MNDLAARGDLGIAADGNATVIDLAVARRKRQQANDPWVKKERIAEFFDVHPKTIYRWVRDEGCPYRRLPGGTMRFQLEAVKEWVARRTRSGSS